MRNAPSAVAATAANKPAEKPPQLGVFRDFGGIGKDRLRWENTKDSLELELYLDDAVEPNNLCCECAEGWLCVYVDADYPSYYEDGVWGGEDITEVDSGPPLLLGRLAHLVVGPSMKWDVGTDPSSGIRSVQISVPKAKRLQEMIESECIFDETLTLSGKPCLEPGLSQGELGVLSPFTTAACPSQGSTQGT